MNWRNTKLRYGGLSIGLHWLMLLLIASAYTCAELRGFFPRGSAERSILQDRHTMLGLLVFCLVWIRLITRFSAPRPSIQPAPLAWQNKSAELMHFALYVFMIAMPVAGWFLLSAQGRPIPFLNMQLPALIGQNKELARTIKEIHEAGATLGYFLIGLHAVAALYHHYMVRDNTLRRMLPIRD